MIPSEDVGGGGGRGNRPQAYNIFTRTVHFIHGTIGFVKEAILWIGALCSALFLLIYFSLTFMAQLLYHLLLLTRQVCQARFTQT